MKERSVDRTTSISKTISTNNLFIFNTDTNRGKKQRQVACLKNDMSLFSRKFIVCQNRDGDLDNFFQHENQDYPPYISIFNELRSSNKADLLKYLEKKADSPTLSEPPQSETVIIDGPAIVNALKSDGGMTFKGYAVNKFTPRISRLLSNVKRTDVVFDVYLEDSLKSTARLHCGQGSRKRIRDIYKVPSNWQSFLRHSENKTELFSFFAIYGPGTLNLQIKQWLLLLDPQFCARQSKKHQVKAVTSCLELCNHEEACTRIFLHMKNELDRQGLHRVLIYTVDTDVVFLAISAVTELNYLNLSIAFGTGTHFRYLNMNNLANSISHDNANVLPMFHAGCDTVSFFAGQGKMSSMDTWSVYTECTEALSALLANPAFPPDKNLLSLNSTLSTFTTDEVKLIRSMLQD